MRPLPVCSLAERWVALHARNNTSHVGYRFAPCRDRSEQKRFLEAVNAAAGLESTHILKVQEFAFEHGVRPYVITPFGGDVDGLRSLDGLLRQKNGQLTPAETGHAIEQILEAVHDAHTAPTPVVHGTMKMDEILVDRHGRLHVELYGLARGLRREGTGGSSAAAALDELRSVVEMAYQLLTGLRAEEPMIPAGRLVKRLDPRWDEWLARGLDPVRGYESAGEAIEYLPARRGDLVEIAPGGVRGVLSRLRAVGGVR
jgi:serine/threonine protein kinase